MKRVDISNFSTQLFDGADIRPSQYRKIYHQLFRNNIAYINLLCQKTELDLLAIEYFDEKVVDIIKNALKEYGLSLGMTEEELAKYDDAEYDERHAKDDESESHVDLPNSLGDIKEKIDVETYRDIIANQLKQKYSIGDIPGQEEKKFVPLTDVLRRKLMYLHERKVRDSLIENLTKRGNAIVSSEDIEFIRIHLFRTFYSDQPWYIRLFKNQDERISIARKDAENLLRAYLKDLIDDIVIVRQKLFSKELDECWEKNWYNILETLEK